jgi:hypothetical protein
MDCSPQALIDLATCTDRCVPAGMMVSVQIAQACGGGSRPGPGPGPVTPPIAPVDLGVVAGDSENTLSWPAGVGATGYNIKRSLVAGGPYTIIGTSVGTSYVDNTAVNGTQYFYVVSSTNSGGESSGNSIESHGTPAVGTGFSFAPPDRLLAWTDSGGNKLGNLATFQATADIPTVTLIDSSTTDISNFYNISSLPALVTINASHSALVGTLDCSNCPNLVTLICDGNVGPFLTGINTTGDVALQTLNFHDNALGTVTITGCLAIVTLWTQNNPSLVVVGP